MVSLTEPFCKKSGIECQFIFHALVYSFGCLVVICIILNVTSEYNVCVNIYSVYSVCLRCGSSEKRYTNILRVIQLIKMNRSG